MVQLNCLDFKNEDIKFTLHIMQYPHSKKYIKKDGLNHLASMYHVFARYLSISMLHNLLSYIENFIRLAWKLHLYESASYYHKVWNKYTIIGQPRQFIRT